MATRMTGVLGAQLFRAGSPLLMCTLLIGGALGCGTAAPPEEGVVGHQTQSMGESGEEPEPNGLGTNGLGTNGLGTNGLGTNGLGTNGLNTEAFSSWLEADPAVRSEVMKYLIACALPEGETRTFTRESTGETYTWYGHLGLTPQWGAGAPATEVEEQIISACLAAHANPYRQAVVFSIHGRTAEGTVIPSTPEELAEYNVHESCFFGNLFREEGLYAGNDRGWLNETQSSLRGCGLSNIAIGTNPVCEPILRVGACSASLCTLSADGTFYEECSYNGVVYRPITTRIKANILYACGDGVCQLTEQCGTGTTPDDCGVDCGACP